MMDALQRAAVKAMLGGGAFVRLAAEDDALLVSDAPRRMGAVALESAVARLAAAGYACRLTARGLLAIDWDERRWEALAPVQPVRALPDWPQDDGLYARYALARLLLLHPAPLAAQPLALLRAMVKASATRDGLDKAAPALLAACAQRLRRREALPAAAVGLLLAEWQPRDENGEGAP